MSNMPTILGISMGPQKNRRLLVVVTYTILAAFDAVVLIVPSWVRELGPFGHLFLLLGVLLLVLFPLLFADLAKLPMPGWRSDEMTRLGVTPGTRDPDDPDERQVAIRNAAHYQAFRVVTLFSFVLFVTMFFLSKSAQHRLMMPLVLLLVFIVLSLPQAIILWTEPDAPEEDQAYNSSQ